MSRLRIVCVTVVCAALVCGSELAASDRSSAGARVRWVSGIVETFPKDASALGEVLTALGARSDERHVMVQFDSPVAPSLRADLRASGLRLLSYLGDNAFFASMSETGVDAEAIAGTGSLIDVQEIRLEWRLHPYLLEGNVPQWAVVSPRGPKGKDGPTIVGAYVMFHPDVALTPSGVHTVWQHGARIRSHLESINALVIELPYDNIQALAGEDVVQWLEPPLPGMVELNDSNRQRVGADIVHAPPYGLDGSGVTVLVYDGGKARATHVDFQGRLTVGQSDTSSMSSHSTHVSGTVGGAGIANSTYKGMAPGVLIASYGFEQEGGLHEGFLYSDPGDLEADYGEAISLYGADISNNSIGTNTASNGYPCEWEGNYGVTGALIDAIVRGSLGAPFRIVWANGNERQTSRCLGIEGWEVPYHSTAPPACAKNHITVGAMNSNDDSVTSFTSFGPSDDGRMKPDVSGPGCQSNDDYGVTSCSSSSDTSYTDMCGTSMSSPTVCGLGALLLQDYRAQYPETPDPRNSTLKILFAHTAVDLFNPGPDNQTGYGSVRIQPAVDLLRSGSFLEATVDLGGTYSVLVVVNAGEPELKATIAWDDPPGTPNVMPVLVNDLDLMVYDPMGVQQYPWTLSSTAPGAPAVRDRANHVDNIEQVYVESPMAGAWRVEVLGRNMPSGGSQVFSLCATPPLINCSPMGVISLDRAKYFCQSTATVQVVDCDLNTDDGEIETVTIHVDSDSEPDGEPLILTETAPESAAFRGSIDLDTVDDAGVLLVAHGDTVTATYIDADDGFGGYDVTVEVTALVDCQGPVISNVQAIDIEPRRAKVSFDTDEPTLGAVRYGLDCGALNEGGQSVGYHMSHTISLTGLTDGTTYYYAVDAEDEAGNASTDDNGGSCYSFTTPDVPDFFTQEFGTDNDLDNWSLVFTPNGSYDHYDGCAEQIISLPTNPIGGTPLVWSNGTVDDGYATLTLSGGATVSLYGESYSTFYPGTNGYITFTGGDTGCYESLADHFAMPRISALFDDLNPEDGGTVTWKQLEDRAAVTWQNVPEYYWGGGTGSNTFQIEMYFDGKIVISYLAISAEDGIAGLSRGEGLDPDFLATDLSDMGECMIDCNNNGIPDDEDIAGGTSTDCNTNLIPDECDIAECPGDPACEDCNGNELPDECDLADCMGDPACEDCNENQIPDGCDIAGGLSGDCNENGIPDECDIADCSGDPACEDCNGNEIPDGCDIAGGASTDQNGNGVPDECEVAAPSVACEGPRYLLVTPQPGDLTLPVALELTGDADDPNVSCVSLYVQEDGTLDSTPVFKTPAEWGTLHVRDEAIIPSSTYHLREELEGGARSEVGSSTVWVWADADNNGMVNIGDVLLSVMAFVGDFTHTTLENVDLMPCTPDHFMNIDDVLAAVDAFVGDTYQDSNCPMPCP